MIDLYKTVQRGRWLARVQVLSGMAWGVGFSLDVWEPGLMLHVGPLLLTLDGFYQREL